MGKEVHVVKCCGRQLLPLDQEGSREEIVTVSYFPDAIPGTVPLRTTSCPELCLEKQSRP